MEFLYYIYLLGAVATLILLLWHMSRPQATALEILGMTTGKYSALSNFVGNLLALIGVPAIWPGIVIWCFYQKVAK